MKELPTIQELQSFIVYNKTGNFTLAAQQLNITQSAFSAQMKKLERVVGVKLIDRSTRGSSLTLEGERFLPEAERIMESLERSVHAIRLASKLERPVLNIGILRSMGDIRLNQYVSYFSEDSGDFALNIYDMEEEEVLLDLRESRIDIALLYLPNDKDMSMYTSTSVREDAMVYYAPRLIKKGKRVSRQEAIDNNLVMYPPKYFMARALKTYFEGFDIKRSNHNRLSNPYAMINYCQQNDAGAIVSKRLLDVMGVHDGYAELEQPLNLQVCFAYRKSNSKWDTMKRFMDHVVEETPKQFSR
jgi:lysR substrate binding domain protein